MAALTVGWSLPSMSSDLSIRSHRLSARTPNPGAGGHPGQHPLQRDLGQQVSRGDHRVAVLADLTAPVAWTTPGPAHGNRPTAKTKGRRQAGTSTPNSTRVGTAAASERTLNASIELLDPSPFLEGRVNPARHGQHVSRYITGLVGTQEPHGGGNVGRLVCPS